MQGLRRAPGMQGLRRAFIVRRVREYIGRRMAPALPVAYHGSMENFLIDERPLRPKDWAFDVAVAAVAYGFGCIQMVLAASSLVMPDETLRRLLGIEAIVPTTAAFVALALTVFPAELLRKILRRLRGKTEGY